MGLAKFLKSRIRRKTRAGGGGVGDDARKSSSDGRHGVSELSWDEIDRLTRGFAVAIGHGGFSTVYLAEFPGGASRPAAAVKVLHGCSQRLFQAFQQELEILLRIGHHDRIVNLLGYCNDTEKGVLVFEYVSNGTLQDKLHGSNKAVLPWNTRVSIVFQLAQAMAYLHDVGIVHGDIKPSNMLLDESLHCKLCDFGSAKMGFSSSVVPNSNRATMVGSPGYTDPLYIRTGLASKKNDVYSFGVVVLELITGLEAVSATSGERLAARVDQMLRGVGRATMEMVDPQIRGEVDMDEVGDMIVLSGMCLNQCPNVRPTAMDTVNTLRSRVPSSTFSCSSKKAA